MTTVLQALGSRPVVCSLALTPTRHVRNQNAGGPGKRFERLPRRLVITFAGQGSPTGINSGLVRRAAASRRPIIQQLKGCPRTSNIVGEPESNEDRYWPGELSALHDDLQRASAKIVASNMHGALGQVRSSPSVQYLHANVGLGVSAVLSARVGINQDTRLPCGGYECLSGMIWRLLVLQNGDAGHASRPMLSATNCRPLVEQPLRSGTRGTDHTEFASCFDPHRLGPVHFPQHEGSPRRPRPIVGFPQSRQRLISGQNTSNPGERRQGLSRFFGRALIDCNGEAGIQGPLEDRAAPRRRGPVLKKCERFLNIVDFGHRLTGFGHDAHRQWKLHSVHRSPPGSLSRLMIMEAYSLRVRDIKLADLPRWIIHRLGYANLRKVEKCAFVALIANEPPETERTPT